MILCGHSRSVLWLWRHDACFSADTGRSMLALILFLRLCRVPPSADVAGGVPSSLVPSCEVGNVVVLMSACRKVDALCIICSARLSRCSCVSASSSSSSAANTTLASSYPPPSFLKSATAKVIVDDLISDAKPSFLLLFTGWSWFSWSKLPSSLTTSDSRKVLCSRTFMRSKCSGAFRDYRGAKFLKEFEITFLTFTRPKIHFASHVGKCQAAPPGFEPSFFSTWLTKCIFGSVKAKHVVSNPFT